MIKEIILGLSMLLTVQYCTYNEDNGVFEEVDYSELTEYNTGLPVVEISTPKAITSKDDWVEGSTVEIFDKNGNLTLSSSANMKGRGNSTWEKPKKPYAIKFDEKQSVFDMPKHKRWVLLANYIDRTLLRNDISFQIAKRTSLAWTPKGEFVELKLNGKHQGNYYLCEQIKVNKNRVNISDDGYLMELDIYYDEVNKFKSSKGLPYMFKEPDEDALTDAQFNDMKNFINALEASLYDDNKLYSQDYLNYIDINSFIDYWFVQELTLNLECNHPKSTYCYRETGGKLHMGPVWDFDCQTFSYEFYSSIWDEDRSISRTKQFAIINALYYNRLFKDPYFKEKVQERWEELRYGFYDIPMYIGDQKVYVRRSNYLNYEMWPLQPYMEDELMTYDDAVNRLNKIYMEKLKWMDKRIQEGNFNQH